MLKLQCSEDVFGGLGIWPVPIRLTIIEISAEFLQKTCTFSIGGNQMLSMLMLIAKIIPVPPKQNADNNINLWIEIYALINIIDMTQKNTKRPWQQLKRLSEITNQK